MMTVIGNKYINKSNFLILTLVCFFLSEAATTIAFQFKNDFHNYSALVKGVFMIAFVIYSLFRLTEYRKKVLIFSGIISFIFFIGQFAFNKYAIDNHFFKNLIYFSRYIFIFVIGLVFMENNIELSKRFFGVYEKIVVLNSILILIGVVFDISIFQTYSNRFGYSGLFMTPSIVTYFYALALTYFAYQYIYKKEKLMELILVSIICFLTGTKALLFFFGLTILHLIFVKKLYKSRSLYIILLSILLLFYLFRQSINRFLLQKFESLFIVYNEHGLITALTSLRNQNLKEYFFPVISEKWNFLNYLFGGTDFKKYRVEFEIFDVFLFFGIIGTVLYLFYYFKCIMNFKSMVLFGKVQMGFLLLTALLSGNFFNNAPVALYLLVVLSILQYKTVNE